MLLVTFSLISMIPFKLKVFLRKQPFNEPLYKAKLSHRPQYSVFHYKAQVVPIYERQIRRKPNINYFVASLFVNTNESVLRYFLSFLQKLKKSMLFQRFNRVLSALARQVPIKKSYLEDKMKTSGALQA